MVGRSTEREELDRLLESAHGGLSGRLLVVGDPGIGTSTVIAWLRDRARHLALNVTAMRGPDLGAGSDLLGALAGATDSGAAVATIDDAHLAEPAALDRLAEAVDRLSHRPLTVVAGTRNHAEVTRRLATWPRLGIRPLDQDDSLALLERNLGDRASPLVLFRLAEALDGNPLALEQVPHLLTAEQLSGRAPLPARLPVPPALDQAWGSVLAGLPVSVRAAALDLAVGGPRRDLLAALGRDAGWTDGDLGALVDAGIAVERLDGAPMFVHPVVRDVVLGRATAVVLRTRYRRAAEIGIELHLPPREVTAHLVGGVVTADEGVAAALEVQARRAEELDQFAAASDAWRAAARLSTTGPARIGRGLSGLRLVITHGLDYADTDELLDLLAGEQLEAECAIWVEWLRTLQRSEADPQSAATAQWSTIRRARDAAPDTLRALLWDAAMNAWSLGDVAAGLRAAREFAEVQRTLPSLTCVEPPWAGSALLAAGLLQAGDVAAATEMRTRVLAEAAATDPQPLPFDQLLSIVFLDDLLLDTSPESADRLLVAAQRAPDRTAAMACLFGIRAWRSRATGQWTQAHRLLNRGRPIATLTGATGPQLGMAALACELASLQGDDDILSTDGARLRAHANRIGDRRRLATLDRAEGMRALVDGRLDAALVGLAAAADVDFLGRGLRDGVIPSRADIVEVLLRQDDAPAAVARAAAVCDVLSSMADPLARALDLRVRALVSDDMDLLHVALEAHAQASDPFEEARTRLLLAERLRRDHQRSKARAQLLMAESAFAALGADPWLARTRAELRATGGRPEQFVGLETLTPQEMAVAREVASGRSNREVAEALFLSPRTVEYHLGNVYRKLGVHGRSALAHRLAPADSRRP